MPKFSRTKHASYLPEEFDDLHLIEEEEEEEDPEDEDDDDDLTNDGDDDTTLTLDEDDDELEDADEDEDEDLPLAASDEDEDDEEEEERRKPTRRETRIRQLAKERKEARAEAEAAKEQLRLLQQSQTPQQRQPSAAEEAAYRASLTPEDLIRYDVGKVLGAQRQQNELLQFNMQDMVDKQGYDAQASANPVMKKFAGQVEVKLKALRMQGMNVPRLAILQNIIGERVLAGNGKKTVSRTKAKENVKRNKVKASSNRSDRGRDSSRSSNNDREARRKRLEGVTF